MRGKTPGTSRMAIKYKEAKEQAGVGRKPGSAKLPAQPDEVVSHAMRLRALCMRPRAWVGVDFDGTLAAMDDPNPAIRQSDPIYPMVDRVRYWLMLGIPVHILTARAHSGASECRFVADWCMHHLGRRLPVRPDKDYHMIELWDDRARRVLLNRGLSVEESSLAMVAKFLACRNEEGMWDKAQLNECALLAHELLTTNDPHPT